MVRIFVVVLTSFLILLLITRAASAIIKKQPLFGKPPIPAVFFMMAKVFAFTNICILILYGLNFPIITLYDPPGLMQFIGLALLTTGVILAFLTSSVLKKDLIFGLPQSEKHTLQTQGVYSISRHPFYLGFLLVLFSSVMLVPNLCNISSFAIAWMLHHFIMIREEEFLISKYGTVYQQYMKKVRRYL